MTTTQQKPESTDNDAVDMKWQPVIALALQISLSSPLLAAEMIEGIRQLRQLSVPAKNEPNGEIPF